MICLFSKHLAKLSYTELGPILQSLGFEGCDLNVRPGGHVDPQQAPVDLLRSIEEIRGAGVDVPMISTAFTSANDAWARPVIGISGGMKVSFFRPGLWKYGGGDIDSRLTEVKRDIIGLGSLGRAYGMSMGLQNESGGYVGESVWDTRTMIADLDPHWVGYCFDPCHATAEGARSGWNIALRLALPRLKMVAVRDFYWAKDGGKWTMRMCPLGEGMVEWPTIFSALAQARFTGPLTLHLDYNLNDDPGAIGRDLEYIKKQIATAYGTVS
jgi:sugar phosphate isomerase/epimerase